MRYNKKKIESAGWGSATFYKNYIELTRKKGVTKIAYYVYGEVRFLSIYDYTELSPQKMKLRTSNRRLNFSLDLVNSKDKYSKGVYTSIAKVVQNYHLMKILIMINLVNMKKCLRRES